MGVDERTHPGQLLASTRDAESAVPDTTCQFCGTPIDDDTERIDHVLPSDVGQSRTDQYCSPSCFVRQMEQVGSVERGAARTH